MYFFIGLMCQQNNRKNTISTAYIFFINIHSKAKYCVMCSMMLIVKKKMIEGLIWNNDQVKINLKNIS